jgi:hypothetical protein
MMNAALAGRSRTRHNLLRLPQILRDGQISGGLLAAAISPENMERGRLRICRGGSRNELQPDLFQRATHGSPSRVVVD